MALFPETTGYFLIRVSESRIGYTLSYRATDRCRHFMIDVLKDNHYIIVGEDMRHRALQDLVNFHCTVPVMHFNELLTVACGQVSTDKANYAEPLFLITLIMVDRTAKPVPLPRKILSHRGPSQTNLLSYLPELPALSTEKDQGPEQHCT
ncbi:hypothetical protein J4Q44_G00095350 [Coregonus suidteri]|uniref:SH2 domain-containing protein n=1 Tax=Coregonus suidteri TaxID=861788 RepID=A0AAN8LX57_9TELE